MAGAKHHDYHLVNPSVWPLIGSVAAMVMFFGLVMYMHEDYFSGVGKWVLGLGFMGVIATFFSWWGTSSGSPCQATIPRWCSCTCAVA